MVDESEWMRGRRSLLTLGAGAAAAQILTTSSTASAGPVVSPTHVVLVEDYASFVVAEDWGPAIKQAFLDNPGRNVYLGARTYVVRSTIEIPTGMLIGAGRGATRIVASFSSAGQDLVRWTGATTPPPGDSFDRVGLSSGARGLCVVVAGAHLGAAFRINPGGNQYFNFGRLVEFTDLLLRGKDRNTSAYGNAYLQGATTWIQVTDCSSCVISEVTVWGTFNIKSSELGQLADTAIFLSATATLLTARISNVEVGPIHTALRVLDNAFYSLSHFDFIGTYYGIVEHAINLLNEPKVSHGNINAQHIGIWVENTGARDYDDITIRRHREGVATTEHAWWGIFAAAVNNLRIHGCTIQPDFEDGDVEALRPRTGIYLGDLAGVGCNGIVDGCKFGNNLDDCIQISNSSGVMIGNNVLLGSPKPEDLATYLRLIDNARRIHVTARPAISATVAIDEYQLLALDNVDRSTLDVDLIDDPIPFTPALLNVIVQYSNQHGRYTQSGRRFEFEIDLTWHTLGQNDASYVQIQLPKPSISRGSAVIQLHPVASDGLDLTKGPFQPFLFETGANDLLGVATKTGVKLRYNSAEFKSSGRLLLTGYYWTA